MNDSITVEQPQGEHEPVAKVVLTEQLGLPCLQWLDLDRQFDFKGGELLYTHPQPKREPLTDADIGVYVSKEMAEYTAGAYADYGGTKSQLIHFARAIERAHGIGGEA